MVDGKTCKTDWNKSEYKYAVLFTQHYTARSYQRFSSLLCESHIHQAYADDVQIYGSCTPSEAGQLSAPMSDCVEDVASWVTFNRFQLNPLKTKVLWCSSTRRRHQISFVPLSVGLVTVIPAAAVKALEVHLDAKVT